MNLPSEFKWIEKIGVLPKMVAVALQYIGVREIPGLKSNPVIMGMAKELGIKTIYTNDDIAWCAVFMNFVIKMAGKPLVNIKGNKYNLMRAKWLLNWGEEVSVEDAMFGDLVIIDRDGGGHVCLWIADTGASFFGFGGNQSNRTSFAEFPKSRILGVRRYYSIEPPASVKKYKMDSSGNMSTCEA